MKKALIADELAGKIKPDSTLLELLKKQGYERYELGFTVYENETHVWDMAKIIEAVTNCDAVWFSERVEDSLPLYKVLYYLADGLRKQCLYPSTGVISANYFEGLLWACTDLCMDINDELVLLPEGLTRSIWHNTNRILFYAEEMRDWLLANLPFEVPDDFKLEAEVICTPPSIRRTEEGCYVHMPSGMVEHFDNTDFDYERLMEMLRHCTTVTFDGDTELIRRIRDARSTTRS